ncbi:MAG: hypothetical protein ACE5G5_03600 [Candidatus Methylomirabilales bacterium]
MRRLSSLLIGLLVLANLVGCASMFPRGQVTVQSVDELVAAEEYGIALEMLQEVPKTHPEYRALRNKIRQVQARAATYERTTLNRARRKMEEGDWSGALREVDNALDKFPSSVALKKGRKELLRKQAERIRALQTQMLIAEGKWLAEEGPLREELARVAPDDLGARWRLWSTRKEREKTARKLYELGKDAMSGGSIELAKECLALAERLDPPPAIKEEVVQLRWEIARREERARLEKQRARAEERRQEFKRLTRLAKQAMERGEFQTARGILSELIERDPGNAEVRELYEQLNKTVSAKVGPMLERGTILYREGKIEEAKKIWIAVLELDPSHVEAQARVERANRVLEKLRRLKEKEALAE